MPIQLTDLAQFTVDSVEGSGRAVRLAGRFSHLRGVQKGRCWLYVSPSDSIVGDLEVLDVVNGHAMVVAASLPERIAVVSGDRFPCVDGYWRPHHVAMVSDPDHEWTHTPFVARPARYFSLAGARGWQRADAPLPAGATELEVRDGEWDHEHCEICEAKIGAGGASAGFRDPDDHWLCEECHAQFVVPHDLAFLVTS